MRFRVFAAALPAFIVLLLAPPAQAAMPTAPTAAMEAPVNRWIDAYNAHRALPEDIFTDDVAVTDEFPPYVWTGIAGATQWDRAIDRGFPPQAHVETGAPRAFRTDRAGDRASFVLPATLTYVVQGKNVTEHALWLFVVVRSGDDWKIAADTWTGADP